MPRVNRSTDLMVHHDRVLHVLVVSENLQIIGHIHPEDFESREIMAELEGKYTVHFTFPAAGRYILAIDVMTANAEFAEYVYVDVMGEEDVDGCKARFPPRESRFRLYRRRRRSVYKGCFL